MSLNSVINCLVVGLLALVPNIGFGQADWRDRIGWTQLVTEYSGAPVTGAGVAISVVEGSDANGNYMPFDVGPLPPEFAGKTVINATGTNFGLSTHSRQVSRPMFGNVTSIANGATQVSVYSAGDWLDNRVGFATGADPMVHNYRVQNHSWIYSPSVADAQNMLHRIDYIAQRDHVTMIAGTANSGGLPRMLVQGYNMLIVGRIDGGHASGVTNMYGAGRTRPDIVAPSPYAGPPYYTSYTTPIVSSIATVLHQAATGTDAARSDTMRAIIMAGATKAPFPTWNRTTTRPLDQVYGVGQANVYNSYKIVEAGQFNGSLIEPASAIGNYGWDFVSNLSPGDQMHYDIVIDPGKEWRNVSFLLAWNIDVQDTDPSPLVFSPAVTLANFDLDFFDSSGSFLGSLMDQSVATVGNVEHLYFTSLGPGRYTVRVRTNMDYGYALAWSSIAIPEPRTELVMVVLTLALGLTFRRRMICG